MKQPAKLSFAHLSTGTKMLLILSAAMLPLGFIALLTSLDLARSASIEQRTAAQTTTAFYATRIDAVLDQGFNAVRAPVASEQPASYLCTAIARQARFNRSGRPPIAVFDGLKRKICQSYGKPIDRIAAVDPSVDHVWLDVERRAFRFTSARPDGSLLFEADIPLDTIRLTLGAGGGLPLNRMILRQGDARVVLIDLGDTAEKDIMRLSQPLADGRLALIAEYRLAPARARTVLVVLLPLLMWATAAFTGWLIVNRLLLLPLSQLKRSIDAWQGSRTPLRLPRLTTPSHEIRDLAESFSAVAARIHDHEQELEDGLARQTRLTREVHHRVKNNLQVVSSLINLHARGAEGAVADAYGAIQRRVDALAVVHRNHYAELEENRGVSVRALAGELATSLRASAPAAAAGMPIALNLVDVYVTQDVAVPTAFLITEVVELLMHCNPQGSVLISLEATDLPDRANLRIETVGMAEGALDNYPAIGRFERVVTGIARQFRAPLTQDLRTGRFEIQISVHS
ncbi:MULTISPECIES: sensor histidine kinase [unclassified Sphingomonas]|uniref:sensor histidine kinase n=1 Tax=unclassified Sphingomonas TaxID=196159 RepID=UPI0006FC6AC7|nr:MULTISPECIES: sensor histidine kinase [unclassified Sphingomonas]KQX17812.1 histidine kinase [Sphingomonas sp. Root1294]KQY70738.1 histidine kinase [Sphingomonas sp. Root50]KRB91769.1 histidine kinase [Sphingomonas sp. Root720]